MCVYMCRCSSCLQNGVADTTVLVILCVCVCMCVTQLEPGFTAGFSNTWLKLTRGAVVLLLLNLPLHLQIPYSDMTPLQAAVGVVQKGLRPALPPNCPPQLATIMCSCWDASPLHRPSFKELTPQLQMLLDVVREEESRKVSSSKGGLLSKLNLRGGSKDGASSTGMRQQ